MDKVIRLTDACEITTGKLDANAAIENGKYPYFTCADKPLRIDKYAFDCDAVLLAGNNAQGNFHIQRYTGKFNAYQRTYVLIAKPGYDIDFVRYSLELALKSLKRMAQGSQTKFLTMELLNKFELSDLSEDEQHRCISVLKSIDDKILNNKMLTQALEDTARLIYDYWFTQFDFPDENGNPYRSSGGKMVWNDQLKREIPESWEVGTVSDLGEIISGATPSTKEETYYCSNGIAWITPNDLSNSFGNVFISHGARDITQEGYQSCSARLMPAGSIIMSSRAPIGYLAISTEQCCTNQGCKSVIPNKSFGTFFIYHTLSGLMPLIKSQGSGTTFSEISKDSFAKLRIAIPPDSLVAEFESKASSLFWSINNSENQIIELSSIRDWLLPMLINGQAVVGE